MAFSKEWENQYLNNCHMSIWPWSDVISLSVGYLNNGCNLKILEIGFGMGANIPYFLSRGVDYFGIEGSETAFNLVSQKFPELEGKLILGDFIKNKNYTEVFDIVIDRSSMTHNTSDAIYDGLLNISNAMKVGAKYIGIDWFSTEHSEFINGKTIDNNTKIFNDNSCFSGVGKAHFSDKEHLLDIFNKSGFNVTKLTHKKSYTEIPDNKYVFATWNLVAEKI